MRYIDYWILYFYKKNELIQWIDSSSSRNIFKTIYALIPSILAHNLISHNFFASFFCANTQFTSYKLQIQLQIIFMQLQNLYF